MKAKIGIGVITCNRPDLFKICINNIPDVDQVIVINDGEEYSDNLYPSKVSEVRNHNKNIGVGRSKNEALQFLLNNGCNHIFLSEDDVAIKNSNIIEKYIRASEITGLKHFNFAFHGPGNKDEQSLPNPLTLVRYGELEVGLFEYIGGAFSYFHSEVLHKVGLMDERFKNSYEHVDHTYQICKAGYYSPFYYFADIMDSFEDIEDLDKDLKKSVLRKSNLMLKLRTHYYKIFYDKKNGKIKRASHKEVINTLRTIQEKYGDKNFPIKVDEQWEKFHSL